MHHWMCLVKSSNTEISGASEMPQSRGKLFFKEAQLLYFCSKILLININRNMYKVQAKTSANQLFLKRNQKHVGTNEFYARNT